MKRSYVQFSKRIVVAVTACVTLISAVGVILSYLSGQLQQAAEVIKAYISYSTIVFAAYSGNSAVQKWLIKKYAGTNIDNNESSEG